jgi:hypothetical protein
MNFRKDRSLDQLAESGNVAQFISFAPAQNGGPVQTYSRVWQYAPNHVFQSSDVALKSLFANSPEGSINLRSFTPDNPRSREFLYGLTDPTVACRHLNRLINEGLFVIANETVDISDGGVSGVAEAGVIEFAPDDTPRCVEKPGTAAFSCSDGLALLATVYGFQPEIPHSLAQRIEFSIHPKARGFKKTHTLLWESEPVSTDVQTPCLSWPNKFSRHIGDKVFGLLIADLVGMPVPKSLVISRRLRPFQFGRDTGSAESWLRTCPTEQEPGRYTTVNKWIDPFALLAAEDSSHSAIASIISQASVPARFSGAAITTIDGTLLIEGTAGAGDNFMLGRAQAEKLPDRVVNDLELMNQKLRERLGAVRFEWVHDGNQPWIVQLHKGATSSTKTIIVPGQASEWRTFGTSAGLEAYRDLLKSLAPEIGVEFDGEVGLTSHLADLARKSGRPTRLVQSRQSPRTVQRTLGFETK